MITEVEETGDLADKVAALVRGLHTTVQQLLDLTGGEVDAVAYPGGQFYLLQDAQQKIRESEQALRSSESNMAVAQSVAHLGSWELDLTKRSQTNPNPVSWSDELFRIAGYQPGSTEVTDEFLFNHVPQDERILLRQALEAAIRDRQPFSFIHRLIRPDGEERIVCAGAHTFYDENSGQALKVLGIVQDITDARRVEEQLIWNTAFFEAQVSSALDGMLVVDNEDRRILQNQRMAELWNIPPEIASDPDRRGQSTWMNGQLKDSRSDAEKVRYLYTNPDQISRDEIELLNGKCLERYSAPVRGVDGKHYGRIWTFRDITDRKRSETRFRLLVDSNAQGVFFWNTKGEISGANNALLKLVGYSREDLQDQRFNWISMTPPEYASHDQRALDEIALKGACIPYEKQFIRKDNSRVSVLLGAAVFEDNPTEGVCFAVDLTERKLAEARIGEQAALIDEARDAIITRDLECRVTFWSKGAERLFGWTAAEAHGREIYNLLGVDTATIAAAERIVRETGIWNGILQKTAKSGAMLTVDCRWTLLCDDHGQPRSILTIETDITEREKLQHQFIRAQRVESIGTLAGGIAHDLNNILAPIMMSVEILKSTATDPDAESILQTLEVSSRRGADIVGQLLSFARGVEGRRIMVQLASLVQEIEAVANKTFLKHIQVKTEVEENLWKVLGDPTQLHQVLLNLCVNARDAMPKGGALSISARNLDLGACEVGLNPEAKRGAYVVLEVQDDGTGMASDIIDKIFDPFFTTKGIGKGTGLGLSTSLAIIRSHGGFIQIQSEIGRGSTFSVYLPAVTGAAAEAAAEPSVSLPHGHGELILVVDDEASIRKITQRTLEEFGYCVVVAQDGLEAERIFAQSNGAQRNGADCSGDIAVVIMDMMMPTMDGPSAIHALRAIDPNIPIIGVSGVYQEENLSEAARLGVQRFLAKPYRTEALLQILQQILTADRRPAEILSRQL